MTLAGHEHAKKTCQPLPRSARLAGPFISGWVLNREVAHAGTLRALCGDRCPQEDGGRPRAAEAGGWQDHQDDPHLRDHDGGPAGVGDVARPGRRRAGGARKHGRVLVAGRSPPRGRAPPHRGHPPAQQGGARAHDGCARRRSRTAHGWRICCAMACSRRASSRRVLSGTCVRSRGSARRWSRRERRR
jgi:hypothetical protein